MGILEITATLPSNFIVKIINSLVSATSVAGGVILFTLILKAITLPFDIFSRVSMRKNSIKMEAMRPELEKLQRQYADNKDLYNQKMMALYKKNGYSMFGACLPTIITLVIFIVAINGFTSFSSYQNLKYFEDMSIAYNSVIYEGFETDDNYIVKTEKGSLVFNNSLFENEELKSNGYVEYKAEDKNFTIFVKGEDGYYSVITDNSYMEYRKYYNENGLGSGKYFVREDKLLENKNLKNSEGKIYSEAKTANAKLSAEDFIKDIREIRAAEEFRGNGSKFLWIKNIWVTDSPLSHPIESYENYAKTNSQAGCGSCSCSCSSKNNENAIISESDYKSLTAKLTEETKAPNGYFILVFLTAASSLFTQIIMSKSQKAQMELQTVDGQGAQQQKLMTWMLPIMMAIFAFLYTAAFSIYIVLSSVISLLTTLGINFILDKKYSKESTEKVVVRSISKAKEEKKEDKKEKSKKVIPDNDFLSGKADKHRRKK